MNTNVYSLFPDNEEDKVVTFQAALTQSRYAQAGHGAERHVCITWPNNQDNRMPVTQVVQLTGVRGMFSHDIYPVARFRDPMSPFRNTTYELGVFTRPQRDRILVLARQVPYNAASYVNGCRVWMRDLLAQLVQARLIDQALFERIVAEVPLPARQPEGPYY